MGSLGITIMITSRQVQWIIPLPARLLIVIINLYARLGWTWMISVHRPQEQRSGGMVPDVWQIGRRRSWVKPSLMKTGFVG